MTTSRNKQVNITKTETALMVSCLLHILLPIYWLSYFLDDQTLTFIEVLNQRFDFVDLKLFTALLSTLYFPCFVLFFYIKRIVKKRPARLYRNVFLIHLLIMFFNLFVLFGILISQIDVT